jgi:hypothetical protein
VNHVELEIKKIKIINHVELRFWVLGKVQPLGRSQNYAVKVGRVRPHTLSTK